MSEKRIMTGACACGAVRFAVQAPVEYDVCHCTMCRRWTGGAFLSANCGEEVRIEGPVAVWQSSDRAERASCQRCGSPLFFREKASGTHYMSVGAFDDQEGWTMVEQIFIDRKPAHFDFANRTRTRTEAECLAEMAGQGGEAG